MKNNILKDGHNIVFFILLYMGDNGGTLYEINTSMAR